MPGAQAWHEQGVCGSLLRRYNTSSSAAAAALGVGGISPRFAFVVRSHWSRFAVALLLRIAHGGEPVAVQEQQRARRLRQLESAEADAFAKRLKNVLVTARHSVITRDKPCTCFVVAILSLLQTLLQKLHVARKAVFSLPLRQDEEGVRSPIIFFALSQLSSYLAKSVAFDL